MTTETKNTRRVLVQFTANKNSIWLAAILELPEWLFKSTDDPGESEQLQTAFEAHVEHELGMDIDTYKTHLLDKKTQFAELSHEVQLEFLRKKGELASSWPVDAVTIRQLHYLKALIKLFQDQISLTPRLNVATGELSLDQLVQFAAQKVLDKHELAEDIAWRSVYSTLRKLEITRGVWLTPVNFESDYPEQLQISMGTDPKTTGTVA